MSAKQKSDILYMKGIVSVPKKMLVFIFLTMLGCVIHTGTLHAKNPSPTLKPVEGTGFKLFELADNINFPAAKKIYIEMVETTFSKAWMSEHKINTSRRYRNNTLQSYAENFRSLLHNKLANAGWTLLNAPEDGAMKVSAKLFDIHINGPDTVNLKNALVLIIGKSSLELSIYDADNLLVLCIKDMGVAGSPSDSYIETNNVINIRGFNQLFSAWANNFTVFLNLIAESTPTS